MAVTEKIEFHLPILQSDAKGSSVSGTLNEETAEVGVGLVLDRPDTAFEDSKNIKHRVTYLPDNLNIFT